MLHEGYEFVAVFGIFLEIIGFILMIRRFKKDPLKSDVEKFNNKNKWRIDEGQPYDIPSKSIFHREVPGDPNSGWRMPVSKAFLTDWYFKTVSVPLGLVIIGLILQMIQLMIN